MAQGGYLSTYRTYKAGTKRLATWLVQAAKICGVDLTTSSATNKYQIPVGKFTVLAEIIKDSNLGDCDHSKDCHCAPQRNWC